MTHIIPNWPAPNSIKAFASTRIGGCSKAPYQGLNLGMHVGDDPNVVERNRQVIEAEANMPSAPVWLNQTHSTQVAILQAPTTQILDADGSVTDKPNVVCSVMTADCLPVLITNRLGSRVAAVHAGWRGLAGCIVEQALRHFSEDPMVWLGPAIGPRAFEVGEDVLQAFTYEHSETEQAFKPGNKAGKWWADMDLITRIRLKALGITDVYSSNLCTYENPEQFYSYRRDGVTGRQATFIWIEQ